MKYWVLASEITPPEHKFLKFVVSKVITTWDLHQRFLFIVQDSCYNIQFASATLQAIAHFLTQVDHLY